LGLILGSPFEEVKIRDEQKFWIDRSWHVTRCMCQPNFSALLGRLTKSTNRFRGPCPQPLRSHFTMQHLLRGSTAKVNDDNDIDRTPEYKRFIEELVEFHRQRG